MGPLVSQGCLIQGLVCKAHCSYWIPLEWVSWSKSFCGQMPLTAPTSIPWIMAPSSALSLHRHLVLATKAKEQAKVLEQVQACGAEQLEKQVDTPAQGQNLGHECSGHYVWQNPWIVDHPLVFQQVGLLSGHCRSGGKGDRARDLQCGNWRRV